MKFTDPTGKYSQSYNDYYQGLSDQNKDLTGTTLPMSTPTLPTLPNFKAPDARLQYENFWENVSDNAFADPETLNSLLRIMWQGINTWGSSAMPSLGWGTRNYIIGQRDHRDAGSMNMVKAIQAALGVTVDGKYGTETQQALQLFGYKGEKVGQSVLNLFDKLLNQEFSWPVNGYSRITSYFGYRDVSNIPGASNPHVGLDIGTGGKQSHPDILSVGYGAVTEVHDEVTTSAGKYIQIDYGFGREVRYCHLNEISDNLKRGTIVDNNTVLGTMGNTSTLRLSNGRPLGEHLHVTYILNGVSRDPLNIISHP